MPGWPSGQRAESRRVDGLVAALRGGGSLDWSLPQRINLRARSEESFAHDDCVPGLNHLLQVNVNRALFAVDLPDDLNPSRGTAVGHTTRQRKSLADRHALANAIRAGIANVS